MTINSDQVNYLVLRYLSESGFDHSAFTLKKEMHNAEVLENEWATRVPTGHLIDCLQRALMFDECLNHIDEQGREKTISEHQMPGLIPRVGGQASSRLLQNGSAKSTLAAENLSVSALGKRKPSPPVLSNTTDGVAVDHVMTDALVETNRPKIQQLSSVTVLEGHTAGLDQCLWHPSSEDMLVTSSVDGTARIWSLPQKADDSVSSIVLNCTPCRTADKSVTSVAWNSTGTLLATGSYDGITRIWNSSGVKQHRDLTFHTGPIFALKWSRRGDFLLTGAADGMIGVWNTALGSLQQKWDLKSPIMDIEWISDALFLSGCKDGTLRMWQLGRESHVKQFKGHHADIAVLKWNSNINLGATGSDDASVKIWRADSGEPTQVLKYHKAQIHAIDWAPKDFGDYRLLASAARDGYVCIWDVVRGELLHILQHDRAIFTLHFSPANLLATAGEQGVVTIWDGTTGKMTAVHNGRELGMVYNLKFSTSGQRISIASVKSGMVIDLPVK